MWKGGVVIRRLWSLLLRPVNEGPWYIVSYIAPGARGLEAKPPVVRLQAPPLPCAALVLLISRLSIACREIY